jgi:arginyl-tRNA synthetase
VLRLQGKLSTTQELTRKAEALLEQSIPARLKDFEQRLDSVKEKHAGIKARYEEQEKALKEEVANKIGVGALRRVLLAFALLRPQLEPFRILSSPPFPSL